jgi:type II secretory pathway component PulM
MRRYLVTFLFIVVCAAIWFHYIYEPLSKRIESVQQQSKRSKNKSPEDLSQAIATLRGELTRASSAVSTDDQLNTILGYIDYAGMALEHCSVQDKALVVQATGTYKQFLVFFDQLAASTQRLLPRDVRITRSADNLFSLSVVIEAA